MSQRREGLSSVCSGESCLHQSEAPELYNQVHSQYLVELKVKIISPLVHKHGISLYLFSSLISFIRFM